MLLEFLFSVQYVHHSLVRHAAADASTGRYCHQCTAVTERTTPAQSPASTVPRFRTFCLFAHSDEKYETVMLRNVCVSKQLLHSAKVIELLQGIQRLQAKTSVGTTLVGPPCNLLVGKKVSGTAALCTEWVQSGSVRSHCQRYNIDFVINFFSHTDGTTDGRPLRVLGFV